MVVIVCINAVIRVAKRSERRALVGRFNGYAQLQAIREIPTAPSDSENIRGPAFGGGGEVLKRDW